VKIKILCILSLRGYKNIKQLLLIILIMWSIKS
jgi:hypothetical protein